MISISINKANVELAYTCILSEDYQKRKAVAKDFWTYRSSMGEQLSALTSANIFISELMDSITHFG